MSLVSLKCRVIGQLFGLWRKGGTQKKDGFWALVRKHVSRRAVPSANLAVLREMAYFYQWLYWRSTDPIRDANHGRHKEAPATDMLQELGALRRRLLQAVGWGKMQVCCETWQDYSHEEGLQVLPHSVGSEARRLCEAAVAEMCQEPRGVLNIRSYLRAEQ